LKGVLAGPDRVETRKSPSFQGVEGMIRLETPKNKVFSCFPLYTTADLGYHETANISFRTCFEQARRENIIGNEGATWLTRE
jgi:hypothetical protein